MVMDIDFSPYDDISYHNLEVKTGIRCVLILPFNGVKTEYINRDMLDVMNRLGLTKESGSRVNDLETKRIPYMSNGVKKYVVAIYSSNTYFQGAVIRYGGKPLVYSNACLLVGDDFTDLTMEQCYALVKSARALTIDGLTSISVNITDDMDMAPRILVQSEEEERMIYGEKKSSV